MPGSSYVVQGAVEFGLIAACDDNLGAFGGQAAGNFQADPRC
jgi:hypothetical protein